MDRLIAILDQLLQDPKTCRYFGATCHKKVAANLNQIIEAEKLKVAFVAEKETP